MIKIKQLKIGEKPLLDATLYSPMDNESHYGILMCHGLASCKEEFMDLPEKLANIGFYVLTFDFRGHGKSEGVRSYITKESHLNDVKRALQVLMEQTNVNEIVVLGHSLGTTAALRVANTEFGKNIKGLILMAPPSRIVKNLDLVEWFLYKGISVMSEKILKLTGTHIYIPYKIKPQDIYVDKQAIKKAQELNILQKVLSANNYQYLIKEQDNCEYASFVKIPTLVMVASKDLIIQKNHSKEVFDSLASDFKEWIEIEDSGHSLAGDHKNEEVFEKIKQWLDKLFIKEEKDFSLTQPVQKSEVKNISLESKLEQIDDKDELVIEQGETSEKTKINKKFKKK